MLALNLLTEPIANKTYTWAKAKLNCSTNQAETRKSLFEELGLLYVPKGSDKIILTSIGDQLRQEIASAPKYPLDAGTTRRINALLIWALMQCQINRPQSFGSPSISTMDRQSCDVRPYAAAWQIAMDLGGFMHAHEFMGVVRHMKHSSDYPAHLAKIKGGRLTSLRFMTEADLTGRNEHMNPRIYWTSHISGAGQFMEYSTHNKTLTFLPDVEPIVRAALNFQNGCGATPSNAVPSSIIARSWNTVDEYFTSVAGRPCPRFLASGQVSVIDHQGHRVTLLIGYELKITGTRITTVGGAELCQLPLKSACFHDKKLDRLLRIDQKTDLGDGRIELAFGMGRPVLDPAPLLASIEGK